jgi:predicted PurR-regulated permease PerM
MSSHPVDAPPSTTTPTPSSLPAAPLPVWVKWLVSIFVWAVAITLFLVFFEPVKFVLLNLIGAAALAAALRPLARFGRGPHWLRGAIVGLLFGILIILVLIGLVWLLKKPVEDELKQWPQLRDRVDQFLANWSARIDLPEPLSLSSLKARMISFMTGGTATHLLGRTADVTINVAITITLVIVGMIYLLIERKHALLGPVILMLPQHRRPQLRRALQACEFRLRWWFVGLAISMSVIGVLSWIGYRIVGLNFAVPLALFAGFAEIVPNIGALTAFALAMIVAATQSPAVLVGTFVVHSITLFLEAHVIQPLIMRGAVDVPPVITLFTIVLWSNIFGFGGLLLALPIDLIIWSVAESFLAPQPTSEIPSRERSPPLSNTS